MTRREGADIPYLSNSYLSLAKTYRTMITLSPPTPTPLARAQAFSRTMRARRLQWFARLASTLPRPLSILDVGGTTAFWKEAGWAERDDLRIVVFNHQPETQQFESIIPLTGDATDLSRFDDQSFDICFSNSVIEHLYTYENQMKMAGEIRRVGRCCWVQTPNYWFPIEPHFHFPGWQWMPTSVRVALLRRLRCGWRGPLPNPDLARDSVNEVRLLTRRELAQLFPGATIIPEKYRGLVKSWIVHDGFKSPAGRIITSMTKTPSAPLLLAS